MPTCSVFPDTTRSHDRKLREPCDGTLRTISIKHGSSARGTNNYALRKTRVATHTMRPSPMHATTWRATNHADSRTTDKSSSQASATQSEPIHHANITFRASIHDFTRSSALHNRMLIRSASVPPIISKRTSGWQSRTLRRYLLLAQRNHCTATTI